MNASHAFVTVAAVGITGVLGVTLGMNAIFSSPERANDADETVQVEALSSDQQPLSMGDLEAIRANEGFPTDYAAAFSATTTIHKLLPPYAPLPFSGDRHWYSHDPTWDADNGPSSTLGCRTSGSIATSEGHTHVDIRFDDLPLPVESRSEAPGQARGDEPRPLQMRVSGAGDVGAMEAVVRADSFDVRTPPGSMDPARWFMFEGLSVGSLLSGEAEHPLYGRLVAPAAATVWVDGEKCLRICASWGLRPADPHEHLASYGGLAHDVPGGPGARSGEVGVLGWVAKPGFFDVEGPITLAEALSFAGGTTLQQVETVEIIRPVEGDRYDVRKLALAEDDETSLLHPRDILLIRDWSQPTSLEFLVNTERGYRPQEIVLIRPESRVVTQISLAKSDTYGTWYPSRATRTHLVGLPAHAEVASVDVVEFTDFGPSIEGAADVEAIPGRVAPQTGGIRGTVRSVQHGDRVAHVHVTAVGNKPFTTTTDDQGQFEVTDLPPGTYSLTFTAEGYKPRTEIPIAVIAGATTPIEVVLRPE